MNKYQRWMTACVLVTCAVPAAGQVVYFNDFEGADPVGVEWSDSSTDTTPGTVAHPPDKFLGQFGNSTVTLTLDNLSPAHTEVTVSFDLYIIRSWDGNGLYGMGPDEWHIDVANGAFEYNTTFSNWEGTDNQAYPGEYPGADNPPRTGAVEEDNSLGYYFNSDPMDAVYHADITVDHTAGSLVVEFSAVGLQVLGDESWGLDNVQVEVDSTLYPDLVVNAVDVPTSGLIGAPFNANWTVTNDGDYPAGAPWTDRVYVSPDTVFGNGNDDVLGTVWHYDDLPINDSYQENDQCALPAVPGQYWIFVKTDADNGVVEGSVGEDNNVTISSNAIAVQTPDLTVTSVTAPVSAFVEGPAEVGWTVRNVGDGTASGAAGSWVDRVYLSTDTGFDQNDDVYVDEFVRTGPLDADEQYSRTETVTVPAGTPGGDYYFIVVTDFTNQVTEYGGENNNDRAADATTEIIQLLFPDLEVIDLYETGARYVGQRLVLGWQIENTGAGAANGNWVDRVYLSEDSQLDLGPDGDEIIAQNTLATVLDPSESYYGGTSFYLPQTAGDYWLFVVTDVLDTIEEEDDENNVWVLPLYVLAPEYTATVEADVDTAPIGTSVTLSGLATLIPSGLPAVGVDVEIRLVVRGIRRVFTVQSELGGVFSKLFTPLGDEAGLYSVSADHPAVEDETPEDQFTLYGLRPEPASGVLSLVVDEAVEGSILLRNLGDTPLTNIQISFLDWPANIDVDVDAPTNLAALEVGTVDFSITAEDTSVSNADAIVQFSSDEGATADLMLHIEVRDQVPGVYAEPESLHSAMPRGEHTYVECRLTNLGGADTGTLQVQLPPPGTADWLGLASPETIGPLAPNESATVVLRLAPDEDLPLGPYVGSVVISGSQTYLPVPFEFVAVSEVAGSLQVEVTDEFYYFAPPPQERVAGATVTVRSTIDGSVVAWQMTGSNGIASFPSLLEAYYTLEVRAERHTSFHTTILLPGEQQTNLEAFLSRELVTYEWSVVPTGVEDTYDIVVEANFETNVWAPVVTIDPPLVNLAEMQEAEMQVDFEIANHGLVGANNVRFAFSEHPRYVLTPLTDHIGDLGPGESVVAPLLIEDTEFGLRDRAPGDCIGVDFVMEYDQYCGIDYTYFRPVYFLLPEEECPEAPGGRGGVIVPPPGGTYGGSSDEGGSDGDDGTGWGGWGPDWGGGWGGPFVDNPTYVESKPCNPCHWACAAAVFDCGVGFIPIPGVGCAWGLLRSCSGLFGPYDAISCGLSMAGCVPGFGAVPGVIGCLYGIVPDCLCLVTGGGDRIRGEYDYFLPIEHEGVDDPALAYYIECANRQLTVFDYLVYIFGDTAWFDWAEGDGQVFTDWIDAFQLYGEDTSDDGHEISASEQDDLLAISRPSHLTDAMINQFIDRWNLTFVYAAQGIYDIDDVPVGWSTDFIASDILETKLTTAINAVDVDESEGFTKFLESAEYAKDTLFDHVTSSEEGFCATVSVQISQQAVVSRSAFEARLVLANNGDEFVLQNVAIDITIYDQTGAPANSVFYVFDPVVTGGLSCVDGTESLATLSTADAEWLIVPEHTAAPTEPTVYYVSGQLSYVIGDDLVTEKLFPVPITVHPDPSLQFHYYLEKVVYGDDPFTPETEPAVPFGLGLLVTNDGAGEARDLRITSAQPEIVDNQDQLLIDFTILGMQVDTELFGPSLSAYLGDVLPGQTKFVGWLLTATLEGEFTTYSATYAHLGPLGKLGLSIIDGLDIHEMNHVVRVDYPADDGIPDMLVNETPDSEDLPDELHGSDGTVSPVTPITNAVVDGPATAVDPVVEVDANLPTGVVYVPVDDPADAKYPLASVVRSDARVVRLGDNAWTTSRILRPQGQPEEPQRYLHIVDWIEIAGHYTYTVTYDAVYGDLDYDGDVDLDDYAVLHSCLAGPEVSTPPGECTEGEFNEADLDGDADVDLADFMSFQGVFPG